MICGGKLQKIHAIFSNVFFFSMNHQLCHRFCNAQVISYKHKTELFLYNMLFLVRIKETDANPRSAEQIEVCNSYKAEK